MAGLFSHPNATQKFGRPSMQSSLRMPVTHYELYQVLNSQALHMIELAVKMLSMAYIPIDQT